MPGGANWFIALPIGADELPRGIIRSSPAGLRRLEPADLHVTVAFLGAVGESCALAAWSEIAEHDHAGPFTATTGALAGLGRPDRPSAYGLDLVAADAFTRWLGYWRDRLRAVAGLPPETRSVRPHVTLARPPRRSGPTIQRQARQWLETAAPEATTLRLDRLALYTSASEPGPQRYQQVRELVLGRGDADAED